MCLNDKEIIASIEYSEEAKKYRDSLKYKGVDTDIMQKIMDEACKERQERLSLMLGNAYRKGREDMKLRIENMILQSIIDLKEHPVLKEELNEFKIGVLQSVFRVIKEMK